MKTTKTKFKNICVNEDTYVSEIVHTVEYEPIHYMHYLKFLKVTTTI